MAADRRALNRRLRPLYVTGVIQSFALWYGIEKEFQVSIGFTPVTITLATVIYNVVMLAATAKLGILADRWSRKKVLHLATLGLVIASLVCGLSRGFWLYVVGLSVWGLFYACWAGMYDTLTWDTLQAEVGSAGEFQHYYGRVQRNEAVAFIAGGLLSSVLLHAVTLRAEYLLTVPVTCLAFVSLRSFREPEITQREGGATFSRALRSLATKQTAWTAIALALNLAAMRLIFEFMQLWYLGSGMAAGLFGVAFAAVYLGNLLAGHYGGRLRRAAAPMVGLVALAASVGLFIHLPAAVVAAQVVVIAGIIGVQNVMLALLHEAITDSGIRASTSSTVSTASMAMFVPLALGFGAVAKGHGVFTASWFVVLPLAAMSAALIAVTLRARARRQHAPSSPAVRAPELTGNARP
jgi:predicted MFS family arabinose efflux permease